MTLKPDLIELSAAGAHLQDSIHAIDETLKHLEESNWSYRPELTGALENYKFKINSLALIIHDHIHAGEKAEKNLRCGRCRYRNDQEDMVFCTHKISRNNASKNHGLKASSMKQVFIGNTDVTPYWCPILNNSLLPRAC